jgi:N4-gp56 family major capsid protein
MGTTSYGVNDPLAVKLWSRTLDHEALKFTDIGPLIGDDANSVIHRKTEMQKGPGDQVTFGIRMQLQGAGFTENQLAEGNGEQLTTYNDKLLINELGHVVGIKSENSIDAQRIPFNMRSEARDGLADWWAKRYSVSFFNQVGGYTPQVDIRFTGLNAITAPSADRIIRQGGRASDDLLVAGDIFTLSLIDAAKEKATTSVPPMRPIRVGGGGGAARRDFNRTLTDKYVIYLHPWQITDIRQNTSTGQWLDIQKVAITGGQLTNNPIFTGAVGEYNGVVIRSSYDVCNGVSATGQDVATVKRAVLLGGQAAMIGFGQRNSMNKFRWNEEVFDHKRSMEVSAWAIFGLKKTAYNNSDYGVVVVATYAAPHAF